MRIMVLADEENKSLWDHFEKSKLDGIDLILSAGDLSPKYLSFLATFTKAPVLYIHGNHDVRYEKTPPEGCICIEDDIYVFNGVRILGLGGSKRYKEGPHMYTEKEMVKRTKKLRYKMWRNKGFDILLTHSPAYKLHDADDLPHTGFKCFLDLIDKYNPKYFIYAHVHATYGGKFKRRSSYRDTIAINGFDKYIFDYETGECFS